MTLASQLPALQVVLLMVTAPVVALLRVPGLPWAAATAASGMSFAVAVSLAGQVMGGGQITYDMGGWPAPFGIALQIDSFAALLTLIVTGASSIALLFGKPSLDQEVGEERAPFFYASWLLAVAGLVGIVITGDAFNIFVFMEISSLATYVMVAAGPDRRALTATFKYLMMGTIGATFYLIGVGLIYMMTGTLNLADMEQRIHQVSELRPILVAAGFITVGLALKAAVFPLHVWMPNAYTFAPSVVTVFLAACSTKVALYVLLRFDFFVFQQNLAAHDIQFAGFLMPLAVLAFLVGSTVAIFERNLKRMLGYSSVAQIGYILLGASFVSIAGLTGGIVHMFNHALVKGALFMAVACLAFRYGRVRVDDIAGAARAMPWTMAAFVVGGLSLVGVPLTAGFISKWYLILAALDEGALGAFLVGLIVVSSLLALVYIWRVVEAAYFRPPPADAPAHTEAPLVMLVPTWALALANIYFGLDTSLSVGLATEAAEALLGHLP